MGNLPVRIAIGFAVIVVFAYSCLRQDVRRVDDVYLTNAYIADLASQISDAQASLSTNLINAAAPEIRQGDPTLGILLALEANKAAQQAKRLDALERRSAIYWLLAESRERHQETASHEIGQDVTRSPMFTMVSEKEGRLLVNGRLFRIRYGADDKDEAKAVDAVEELEVAGGQLDPAARFLRPSAGELVYLWGSQSVQILKLGEGKGEIIGEWATPPDSQPLDAGLGLIVSREAIEGKKRTTRFRLRVRNEAGQEIEKSYADAEGPDLRQAFIGGDGGVFAILWSEAKAGQAADAGQIKFQKLRADFQTSPARLIVENEYAIPSPQPVTFSIQQEGRTARIFGYEFGRATIDPVSLVAAFRGPDDSSFQLHDLKENKEITDCRAPSAFAVSLRLLSGGEYAVFQHRTTNDLEIRALRIAGCPIVANIRRAGSQGFSRLFELEAPGDAARRVLLTDRGNRDRLLTVILPTTTPDGAFQPREYDLKSNFAYGFGGQKSPIIYAATASSPDTGNAALSSITLSVDGKISIWRPAKPLLAEDAISAPVDPGAGIGKARYARMVAINEVGAVGDNGLGVVNLEDGAARGLPFSDIQLQQFEPNRLPEVTNVSHSGRYGYVTDITASRIALTRFESSANAAASPPVRYFAMAAGGGDPIASVELSASDSYLIATTRSGALAFADVNAAIEGASGSPIELTQLLPPGNFGARPVFAIFDHESAPADKGLMIASADNRTLIFDLANSGRTIPDTPDTAPGERGNAEKLANMLLSVREESETSRVVALATSRSGALLSALVEGSAGAYLSVIGAPNRIRQSIQGLCRKSWPGAACGSNASSLTEILGEAAAAPSETNSRPQDPRAVLGDALFRRTLLEVRRSEYYFPLFYPKLVFADRGEFQDQLLYLSDGGEGHLFFVGDSPREVKSPNGPLFFDGPLFDDLTKAAAISRFSRSPYFELLVINPFGNSGGDRGGYASQVFQGALARAASEYSDRSRIEQELNPLRFDRMALVFDDGKVAALSVEGARFDAVLRRARASLPAGRASLTPEERLLHGVPGEEGALSSQGSFQKRRTLECPAVATRLFVDVCSAIPGFGERGCLAPMRVFGNGARKQADAIYQSRDSAVPAEAFDESCKSDDWPPEFEGREP